MGMFPAIDRAWITVDNRLYLWNYKNGNDFSTFDELDHTIFSVNLVKPKPGVFVDSINYLLVLCTPVELYILGVQYDKVKSSIEFHYSGINVSISGLDVDTLVASEKSGRIFFSGANDGVNLWEVVYTNEDTWFKGKCSKICHTRSGLVSALTPSFSLPSVPFLPVDGSKIMGSLGLGSHAAPETIISMQIDDTRDLLYTLSSTSTIRIYHIPKGNTANLALTYTLPQILSNFQMASASSETRNAAASKTLKIVSLQVVKTYQSAQFHLVAITSGGFRLYIKAGRQYGVSVGDKPPNTIQVVGYRPPPVGEPVVNPDGTLSKPIPVLNTAKPQSKIFEPAHFFCVVPDEANSGGDKIFVSSLDSGRVIHILNQPNSVPTYSENACFLEVEGFVQSVELLTPPFRPSAKPEGFLNECAAQYSLPPPQVAVLTNTGIYVFTRRLPYQICENLLGSDDIKSFFDAYGRTETCASALSVASKSITGSSSSSSAQAYASREMATKIYIEIGGRAHLRYDDESTYALVRSANNTGSETIRLSGRFDGLATYVSRTIRDLWEANVFKSTKGAGAVTFSLGSPRKSLESVQLTLMEIAEFLERNHAFIEGLSGIPDGFIDAGLSSRAEEISLQAEHRGLDSLVKLIKSCREGLAFLLLLHDETAHASDGLEAVMSYLPKELREKVEELTFKHFFTTADGTELAKELVTCLVNRSISKGESVDSISRVLQDRCESYCSSSDVIIYKALEDLRKAKSLAEGDPELRIQSLYDSVKMFKKAAASIQLDSLKEAISEYVGLKYYSGAIEVALSVAFVGDKGNLALGYLHDGKVEGDPRQVAYDARVKVYNLIFEVLDIVDEKAQLSTESAVPGVNSLSDDEKARQEAYNICFEAQDEVFHFCFYDWFVYRGVESRLLAVNTPYILPYLVANAKTNLTIADLLWVYYQKRGDNYAAAQVLFSLAKSDFDIALGSRLEFLSRARGYCNADGPPGLRSAMTQLGSSIQEHLDIASIQDDILQAVREDIRFIPEKRDEAVAVLNGQLLNVSQLYNDYAYPLGYHEICLVIYQVTDYRGHDEITKSWQKLINSSTESDDELSNYEHVSSVVQRLGQQFMNAEFVFPTDVLVPMLETFSLERAPNAPRGWVIDTFLNAGVSSETIYALLSDLLERKEAPFDDKYGYEKLAMDLAYLLTRWSSESRGRTISHIVSRDDIEKLRTVIPQKEYAEILRRMR
ncbi:Nup170p [Sugiyamaella lignohabitans]|uniref:Nup170p n=1 Tax=Sugiyamaella lignohabitans TaxID=796027 RepID=A0A167C761_9ASCO|nr:Nup170p [Sugiyamaella lignohabitans]ANB11304.1 Nup170p [Sugiyamaella lignohabitans]